MQVWEQVHMIQTVYICWSTIPIWMKWSKQLCPAKDSVSLWGSCLVHCALHHHQGRESSISICGRWQRRRRQKWALFRVWVLYCARRLLLPLLCCVTSSNCHLEGRPSAVANTLQDINSLMTSSVLIASYVPLVFLVRITGALREKHSTYTSTVYSSLCCDIRYCLFSAYFLGLRYTEVKCLPDCFFSSASWLHTQIPFDILRGFD